MGCSRFRRGAFWWVAVGWGGGAAWTGESGWWGGGVQATWGFVKWSGSRGGGGCLADEDTNTGGIILHSPQVQFCFAGEWRQYIITGGIP